MAARSHTDDEFSTILQDIENNGLDSGRRSINLWGIGANVQIASCRESRCIGHRTRDGATEFPERASELTELTDSARMMALNTLMDWENKYYEGPVRHGERATWVSRPATASSPTLCGQTTHGY